MKPLSTIASILLLGAIAPAALAQSPKPQTMWGQIEIPVDYAGQAKQPCEVLSGYEDLQPGTVWVGNADGELIAQGDLLLGTTYATDKPGMVRCKLLFAVKNVPYSPTYLVKIGDRLFSQPYHESLSGLWKLRFVLE